MDQAYSAALFVIVITSLLCILRWKQIKQRGQMPPGPVPLPVIGNWFQMKSGGIAQSLIAFKEEYGPVFTVHLGPNPVVVLWGYDTVREALEDHGEAFSGRGIVPVFEKLLQDFGFSSSGKRWKEMRRFSIMTLRNFGMGRRSIEERIQEEAGFLVQELRKSKGLPFDPTHYFSKAVSNVICSIVFGKRFDYEDKEFLALLHMITEVFELQNSVSGQLYNMFPNIMDYIPGPHKEIFSHIQELYTFVEKRVKMNRETLDLNSPRDFIDCFLIKMEQDKHNPSSEFCMKNLVSAAFGLFFAGTETVSTTLRHSMLLLLKHPNIEERIRKEIGEVVGENRSPSVNDRSKMAYTDAAIHEIQRFCDILPLGIPHTVIQDTCFRGFNIPKGTDVIAVLSSVLRDPVKFPNPEEFLPERFLDDTGGFQKNSAFIPFSIGKRICPGEGLARMELFLFLTTILQNFTLNSTIDPNEIDISPKFTVFSNTPMYFELCVLPTQKNH